MYIIKSSLMKIE